MKKESQENCPLRDDCMKATEPKREISLTHFISVALVVTGAVLGFWISTSVRLSSLEIHQKNEELSNQNIMKALDDLKNGQVEIKLQLKDKADKE